MLLVERYFTTGNHEIIRSCKLSKELYNRCNYLMRKAWFTQQHLKRKKLPDINILVKETKNLECFQEFGNVNTAVQTIRKCLSDWSNFFKALKAYGQDSSKFISRPKPPGYKERTKQEGIS